MKRVKVSMIKPGGQGSGGGGGGIKITLQRIGSGGIQSYRVNRTGKLQSNRVIEQELNDWNRCRFSPWRWLWRSSMPEGGSKLLLSVVVAVLLPVVIFRYRKTRPCSGLVWSGLVHILLSLIEKWQPEVVGTQVEGSQKACCVIS